MPLQPSDLRNKVVLTGSYSGGSATHPGPVLKTAKGERMESPEFSNQKHYLLQGSSVVSVQFTPDPKNPGVITASFRPPGTDEGAVYLPFYANCIASAVVPRNQGNVKYFFTDALSGCSIFIDELPNGDLVVYHANAKDWSPSQAEIAKDAAKDSPLAIAKMENFHDGALASDRSGAMPRVALFKSQYFSAVNAFDQRAKQLRAGETSCGTSVIGFQVGSGWEFWYQTWGKLKTGVTYSVLDAQKFWW